MEIKIDKTEILEEVFKFEPGEKTRKFARRGVKAINNVPYDTFKKQVYTIGATPIVGTIAGGAIGNQIHGSEGEDDEYDMTGAALGLGAGLVGATKMKAKQMTPGDTNKIIDRLAKDKVLLRDNEKKTMRDASTIAHGAIFGNNVRKMAAEMAARQAKRKGL